MIENNENSDHANEVAEERIQLEKEKAELAKGRKELAEDREKLGDAVKASMPTVSDDRRKALIDGAKKRIESKKLTISWQEELKDRVEVLTNMGHNTEVNPVTKKETKYLKYQMEINEINAVLAAK